MADEQEPKQKIGAGHAKAWLRAGGKEIAQILPAFSDSVRPAEEPGLLGNMTPQEVVQDKQNYNAMLGGYAARGSVHGREQDRGLDR